MYDYCDYLHADTDTEFYITQPSTGTFVYESVEHSGNYLVMDSAGFFYIGSQTGKTYEFKHGVLGLNFVSLYAEIAGKDNPCYLAFDSNGDQVSDPCPADFNDISENAKLTRTVVV